MKVGDKVKTLWGMRIHKAKEEYIADCTFAGITINPKIKTQDHIYVEVKPQLIGKTGTIIEVIDNKTFRFFILEGEPEVEKNNPYYETQIKLV